MNRISYPSRRQASDVFNGDPFKIHSYNFRYADKPFYPVQNYQRSAPPTPPAPVKKPSFQTFYQNPRFSQDPEYIPAKRSPHPSSYRRRLLQESMDMSFGSTATTPDRQSVPVAPQTRRLPTATDSPLLRTCCQSGRYEAMRRGPSTTTLCQGSSNLLRSAGGGALPTSTTTFSRNSNTQLQSRRSGCGISINICSADSQSEMDNNVSIQIATDAYLLNNTDKVRTKSQPQRCTSRSSGTFGIDKRLSKFNVSETKPRTSPEWELRQREKAREVARQRERERDRQLLENRRLEQERELQEERERARQRERDREQLRQLERLRDEERLIELEVERERQRLRELERESQRHREYERLCALQEQARREQLELLCQAPINPRPPVPMTSHLYTTTSDDRLPGMAFCDLASRRSRRLETSTENPPRSKARRKTRVNQDAGSVSSATRSLTPPPILTRNNSSPSPTAPCTSTSRSSSVNRMANRCSSRSSTPIPNPQRSATPTDPRSLDRSSSGTSNGNVHVTVTTTGRRSNCSMRRSSNARVSEQKQLNGNQTCVTCLNNMPIRITTSRSRDTDLAFSLNHVRMRGSSPAPRERSSSQESQDSCQVNISVYADKLRLMRL